MPNEIKILYPTGSALTATVFSPDGTLIWTSAGFAAKPATEVLIPLDDDGNEGLYSGDFPTGITAAGNYIVRIQDSSLNQVGSQIINWSGSQAVDDPTVGVISLSTVATANAYFATRLHTTAWDNASADDRQLALNDATRLINRFAYVGRLTVADQVNQWPRSGVVIDNATLPSDVIPVDILAAQYEIALAFLKGIDIEREARGLGVTSRGYSSVRITYDSDKTSEWLMYGIPSYLAWVYLLPYLTRNSAGAIILHRVS